VPLVVPEVNCALLEHNPMLVANPNCSTIAIVMALAPLARVARLERVVVSTYQSVLGRRRPKRSPSSRAGCAPVSTVHRRRARAGCRPFAFNVVPQIDRLESNGYFREGDEDRVGDAEDSRAACAPRDGDGGARAGAGRATRQPSTRASTGALDPEEARALWRRFPESRWWTIPAAGRYPTPLAAAGRDEVLVGRARRDISQPNTLEFFVTSDNLRKAPPLNAVQIAEELCRAGSRTP
jgi:aspartate-semialdehyde dehydrogenase